MPNVLDHTAKIFQKSPAVIEARAKELVKAVEREYGKAWFVLTPAIQRGLCDSATLSFLIATSDEGYYWSSDDAACLRDKVYALTGCD